MKYRVIGTLVVLAILAGLFIITQEPSGQVHQPTAPQNDTGLQPLKIN